MKINPNKQPCTPMQAEQMADEAFHTAIACAMSTVAETDRFTIPEVQELWKDINCVSDKVARGQWSLPRIVEDLERRFNIRVGRVQNIKSTTMAKAKKQARGAFSLACAIILNSVVNTERFTPVEVQQLWAKINSKYDSIRKGYCSLVDMCKTLEEEYGITVGGVLVGHT